MSSQKHNRHNTLLINYKAPSPTNIIIYNSGIDQALRLTLDFIVSVLLIPVFVRRGDSLVLQTVREYLLSISVEFIAKQIDES
jgi:hypothetical protein